MGRKRKKRGIQLQQAALIEVRDADGFYPYRLIVDVKGKLGQVTRVFFGAVGEALDGNYHATVGRDGKTFHHLYKEQYAELCRFFVIVYTTHAINSKHSASSIRSHLEAIRSFFRFLYGEDKDVQTFHDIDVDVMLEYRTYLRDLKTSENSKYKGSMYHPIKTLLENTFGTAVGPDSFTIPLYQTDKPDGGSSQIYSDYVMYQVIVAAISDCETIIEGVGNFEQLSASGMPKPRINGPTWTLENFAWFFVNVMNFHRPPYAQELRDLYQLASIASTLKKSFGLSFNMLVESRSDEEWVELSKNGCDPRGLHKAITEASIPDVVATWGIEASFLKNGLEKVSSNTVRQLWRHTSFRNRHDLEQFSSPPFSGKLSHSFIQREVATRETLLPFLLLFAIFSGRNTEVLYSWKRVNSRGKSIISSENCDPLLSNSVVLEGWKYRGKRIVVERDDVLISMDDFLFEYLEFLIRYTEPLAEFIQSNDLWLFLAMGGKYCVCTMHKNHGNALVEFCERHPIYDEKGNRFKTLDMRYFRKVYITKELLRHLREYSSFDELANDLRSKLKHKKFDTTLSHYLSNDVSNRVLDIGILVLQESFLDEAKAHCTLMDRSPDEEKRVGIPTIQGRCENPEIEYPDGSKHNCNDYDFCLGCKRSRVYAEHLPRICVRVLQYQSKKESMFLSEWVAEYEEKELIAKDVLERWGDKEAVAKAWEQAKSGLVLMPALP